MITQTKKLKNSAAPVQTLGKLATLQKYRKWKDKEKVLVCANNEHMVSCQSELDMTIRTHKWEQWEYIQEKDIVVQMVSFQLKLGITVQIYWNDKIQSV